jgi:hypothetical protein
MNDISFDNGADSQLLSFWMRAYREISSPALKKEFAILSFPLPYLS